ncbi:hypothetical protein CTI12_AA415780 [Artemisia annua]|uniref:Uncharacterized protein n=1 Tax=Artemisia annua TaxID=35608 RepID=A0A2U1M686_ARTAN|nr:hypothetical protein CTI12_AA415780 [Artemisia annua]
MEPSHLGQPENNSIQRPTYAAIVAGFKSTTISSNPPTENKSPTTTILNHTRAVGEGKNKSPTQMILNPVRASWDEGKNKSPTLSQIAPTTTTLLGPPEIHPFIEATPPPTSTVISHPFIETMVSNYNSVKPPTYATIVARGFTENMSPTYLSTGNPCLDFFFHVVPDTPPETITRRLQEAWKHDPLKTLKLICNLRGVRGTGKSDKEGFYTCALWLHKNHPKTLACNVASIADFGYFKDLPELLYRVLEGPDVRKIEKKERSRRSRQRERRLLKAGVKAGLISKNARLFQRTVFLRRYGRQGRRCKRGWKGSFAVTNRKAKDNVSTEAKVLADRKRAQTEKAKSSDKRKEKRIKMAMKAIQRYNRDPDYKFLHECISFLFAKCLRSDMGFLTKRELRKISLAAKWCPSIDQSFDRSTLLCESIAKKVFPRQLYPEYKDIEEAHYAYRVRDRLRKQVLVPLRQALQLPEVYIGKNQWGLIPYNRVASVAMKTYKQQFLKHDMSRFEEYLDRVREGKTTIAAGALLPHKIIASLDDEDGGKVAELQWKRMVNDMLKKGKLTNCLAVCDVSASMRGIPMEVSVALGVLVSELSEEPWKGHLITFSENPKMQKVQGKNLKSKTNFVRRMEWGMNTDFQKVFDLLLEVASNNRLSKAEMIERVFVFSDMEFDKASSNPWETDYQAIKRKFAEKGYGGAVPEIVFWNLRDSQATPVPRKENGVALVSGFSKNLMTMFMEDMGSINPEGVMDHAISGEEYNKLVVVGRTPEALQLKVGTNIKNKLWIIDMTKRVMEMNNHLQSRLLDLKQHRISLEETEAKRNKNI